MIQPENFKLILMTAEKRKALKEEFQTRRVIVPQPEKEDEHRYWWKGDWDTRGGPRAGVCTHGSAGNGEPTWTLKEIAEYAPYPLGSIVGISEPFQIKRFYFSDKIITGNYLDDGKGFWVTLPDKQWDKFFHRKKPKAKSSSLHMYKSLCRKFYEVVEVKVEQVQDISEEDAGKEGCGSSYSYCEGSNCMQNDHFAWEEFEYLWNSINYNRGYGWDVNPHVFAYTLKKWSGK